MKKKNDLGSWILFLLLIRRRVLTGGGGEKEEEEEEEKRELKNDNNNRKRSTNYIYHTFVASTMMYFTEQATSPSLSDSKTINVMVIVRPYVNHYHRKLMILIIECYLDNVLVF